MSLRNSKARQRLDGPTEAAPVVPEASAVVGLPWAARATVGMEAPGGKPWRQLGARTLPHTGPDRPAGQRGGWCQQTLALREKPAVHAVHWPTCVSGCGGRWLWCAQWGRRPPREVGLDLALDFLSTYPSPEHRQLAPLHTWEPSESQHGRADASAGPARGGMLGRPARWGPVGAAFKGPRGSQTTRPGRYGEEPTHFQK